MGAIMRNSQEAKTREAKKFLAQGRTRHIHGAYLNMSCLPRAP
jgi:hypothetical protein